MGVTGLGDYEAWKAKQTQASVGAAAVVIGAGVVNAQAGLAIDLSMPQIEAGTWPTSFITQEC